ncbi:MAG: hypothetical protein MK066_08620 [Crocinitomicaceae bacterium]|nr:hypothetical protein [Crocinitomicaceae bacterium]
MKSTIKIQTKFFFLAWFLYFCTPVIEINGKPMKKKWGTHNFDLAPGDYHIKIFFPYIFMKECGANTVSVILGENETINVTYNMPPWMLSKGKITLS